jgi:hypothetical protein
MEVTGPISATFSCIKVRVVVELESRCRGTPGCVVKSMNITVTAKKIPEKQRTKLDCWFVLRSIPLPVLSRKRIKKRIYNECIKASLV